ncbi:PAS domain S-box protein [Natronoglomus mannanivorans]|uniref:histidine kinase n=1 Tax=Natronoglomus mannanivorans TaxID=2979990 RepID=A0AAP2YZG4_9EURY|nr:PAS domain S-box protein [Halobacteria archaeon AArc-xg1-1]
MSKRGTTTGGPFWLAVDGGGSETEADGGEALLHRYRSLVNTIDDGLYQLDADGHFVGVNDVLVETTGYSRSDLVGKHVSTLLADDDASQLALEVTSSRRQPTDGRDDPFEVSVRTAGGETIRCEFRVNPLVEEGTRQGTVGTVRDVSDRNRARQAVAESEPQNSTEHESPEREQDLTDRILETSPVGIVVLDSDGELVRINERGTDLLGIPEDEFEEFSPSDRPVYDEDGRPLSIGDHPFAKALETGEPVIGTVLSIVLPDGERRWLSVNATPLFDDDGEIDRVVTTGKDVTELKERERRLEQRADDLSTELNEVFGRVSDAFYALDEEFRFTHVNERAEKLLRRPEEELLGESLWELFPEAAAEDEVWDAFHTAIESQEPTSYELYFDPLDLWVEAHVYPSRTGVSVYFRDVHDRIQRERELERSERRYRTLAEYFPNGIVTLFDDDLRYTLAAGQAFDDFPVSAAEIEGQTAPDVWGEDVGEVLEPALRAALDGEERSVELEYVDREWVVHAVPITDAEGDVFAGMTMAQDITEQKERERYLRDAKAQLEAATEAGAIGTWEWDIPADQFVTGASFARQFGVDPEAAREGVPLERITDSIHEADRDHVTEKIEAAMEDCGEYEAEYRVWNADGELRWVVARGHVECDAEGTPISFPGALADITDRKRAERALETQRRQLETVFRVLPVGVVVAEADGTIVKANETAAEIWGGDVFDAANVADYDRYTAWWADTGDRVEPDEWTMAQVLRDEEVTEPNVYEIETVDGKRRVIMEHGMPVRDEYGDVSRAVVTLTDISERREYQRKLEETISKLEESNERLEQFAYAASHDLQEPLRMVSSYLQLIDRRYSDAFDDDGQEFLAFAIDGADRMREMIEGLLEYSRIETRGEAFEPVDLDAVLEDVLDDIQVKIGESDAEITAESLPQVRGDAGQLRQVFQNLLSNAITYSGDEPPRVHVSADRDGRQWTISVRDEGIGIDPSDADRIFEVFHRLHGREEYSGAGIGLALCQRIVERHGGEIRVDSEPGEGATFSFTLPAAGALEQ